jgi:small-conductance mechanosensitive channel
MTGVGALLVAQATTDQAVLGHGLTGRDWVMAGAIVVAGFVLGRILRTLLVRAIHHADAERAAADAVGRFVGMVVMAAGFVYGLSAIGVRLGPLVGALGIGGVALAFAAQAILANFLGSVILQLRRPFRRGDQIATGDCEGVVEDINFRTVVMRTFDGQRVMVPCAQVLGNPITNHTVLGRRRTTLEASVGYDTDLDHARKLLLDAVIGVDGVLHRPPAEVWVKGFGDSGIDLAIRFWHAPDVATLWRVRSEVAVAVKQTLDAAGIDIPFPQRVVRVVGEPSGSGRFGDD